MSINIDKIHSNQVEYLGLEKKINKITPTLSVVTICYNQVKYIEKCLDNIISQITDFDVEIILADDGSTDGTKEKCIEYANKHPDRIRLFLRDRKETVLYENGGFARTLNGMCG